MVRAGLGRRWKCLYANDIDPEKVLTYSANWGNDVAQGDIHDVSTRDLPDRADLAWASFPCQDLSCAGIGLGIGQAKGALKTRSGTFWPFIGLMTELKAQSRLPKIVVLENVVGLLTTNGGAEFKAVIAALNKLNYRLGAAVVDASHFVSQSRPRVFIVAVSKRLRLSAGLTALGPNGIWHPEILTKAVNKLPAKIRERWLWFDLGEPPNSRESLERVVSKNPIGVPWHSAAETRRLTAMMTDVHKAKLNEAKKTGKRRVGTLSLRMRPHKGGTIQRAEISFDGLAACLRTPKGGGSRPRIVVVKGAEVKSRLLSPKEAAALMGLGVNYKLPEQYSVAFKVIGDGVAVPAVSFIRDRLLNPILKFAKKSNGKPKLAGRRARRMRSGPRTQSVDRSAARPASA